MAVDITTFETIVPSRFLCFTIPSPTQPAHLLRVAVLDSPIQLGSLPRVAALFIPQNRESDWIFSTESGHLQLLLSSPGISRLILVGRNPIDTPDSPVTYHNEGKDTEYATNLESCLKPLFNALSPKVCVNDRAFYVPIVDYEDNVVSSVDLERSTGVFVGEMVVEDVEIETDSNLDDNYRKREFRRRLRFKRMPNLVQTEIPIVPESGFTSGCVKIGEVEFRPDIGLLVHPYLIPMVASLSLIGCNLEDRIRDGVKPKALCLGVGGGAMLSFLRSKLGFEVFGVEMDEEVLRVAKQYFGFEDCEIKVFVGDAIELIEKLSGQHNVANFASKKFGEDCCSNHANCFDHKFDVVMVDLDSCDATTDISAPPVEFIRQHILLAVKSILCDFGILVINVMPLSTSFYDILTNEFRQYFNELYEIDVGNGENLVLIAKMQPVLSSVGDRENTFLKNLSESIPGKYLDSIRKI